MSLLHLVRWTAFAVALGLIAIFAVIVWSIIASWGDCAPEIGTMGCSDNSVLSFIIFPGSFLLIALGILAYLIKTKAPN